MTRFTSSAVVDQLATPQINDAHLVEIILDANTYRLSNYYRKLTISSGTYTPVGHLLSVGGLREVARLENNQVTLSLSGVDQNYISAFLSEEYIDRQVKIYYVMLDANGDIVGSEQTVFDGRIDQPVIEDDPVSGTSIITLSCSSHWIDFERVNSRRYSHEEQQFRYPGDKGLEFVSEIPLDLIWGRK